MTSASAHDTDLLTEHPTAGERGIGLYLRERMRRSRERVILIVVGAILHGIFFDWFSGCLLALLLGASDAADTWYARRLSRTGLAGANLPRVRRMVLALAWMDAVVTSLAISILWVVQGDEARVMTLVAIAAIVLDTGLMLHAARRLIAIKLALWAATLVGLFAWEVGTDGLSTSLIYDAVAFGFFVLVAASLLGDVARNSRMLDRGARMLRRESARLHWAHEQLQEREGAAQRLAVVARVARDAILICDADGRVEWVNRAAAELAGRPPEALIGCPVRTIFTDPENDPDARQRLAAAIRKGQSIRAELMLARDGVEPTWVESSITTLNDADGALLGHVNVTREITDAKRRERELAAAKAAAEAAAEAKSTFLATMSHEIRTPLNGIIGTADLLRTRLRDAPEAPYVEMILESGEALLMIVNDVLEATRLEAGHADILEEPFDLPQLVRSTLGVMAPVAAAKGLTLVDATTGALPRLVRGDAGRLRQILLNLIGNALKFTETGGVTLRLDAQADGTVAFEVQDTGIGIAPERLQAIFETFTQADAHVARRFGGTGLGLSISRKLAEAMGGEIGVSSTPGRGSTFTLRLPMQVAAQSSPELAAPVPAAHADRALAGTRILVVEDNRTNMFLITRYLADTGAELILAEDGKQAVEAVAEQRLDVILMDVSMPVMDGLEATRTIRRQEVGPPCPIVGLTANAFDEDRRRCFEAGMTAFLTKPVRRAELLAELRAILGEDRARPRPVAAE
ncbi:hybrid sensor histidine kinase/response regulator [Roseitranquillus sediminis]|uniref:hybrid sensor histidine kinase/response regulator n=1 Tax=Roseitranquillus sediminis TaxID=2809051 RepID=UPI001D0C7424|nr:PAS domain-containing hybrid sensor histidine kinase/response regulator [Roseitranquillus sediminis]MBM9596161.1 response regulator [Roseitranquillus sediminis]